MEWQKWHVTSKGYIKRFKRNNKGSENYPRAKYKGKTLEEIEALVNKLNYSAEKKAKEKYLFESAFIPKKYIVKFREYLSEQHSNERTTTDAYNAFVFHGLQLLQDKFGANPLDWKKNEDEWGRLLRKRNLAPKTIKGVVQTVNRFFSWIKIKAPDDYPEIKLDPITKNAYRQHEKKLETANKKKGLRDKRGAYINDHDMNLILNNLDDEIGPHIVMLYCYGVRLSEACAIPQDIKTRFKKNTLRIDRQLQKVGETDDFYGAVTTNPKWDIQRSVLQDFRSDVFSREEVKDYIKSMKLYHPRTVSDKLKEYMASLPLKYDTDYTAHDFRRTFITDCFDKGFNPKDIMQWVGHKNISTTMGYIRDKFDEADVSDW